MRFTEQKRRELIGRLVAAYSVNGRDALSKMSPVEVYVLHAEKMVELRATQAHLRHYPHDELGQVRYAKAEREANDIAGFLQEKQRSDREMEMER